MEKKLDWKVTTIESTNGEDFIRNGKLYHTVQISDYENLCNELKKAMKVFYKNFDGIIEEKYMFDGFRLMVDRFIRIIYCEKI